MNIVEILLMLVGGVIGIGSTLAIIVVMIVTLGTKIYRKIKYGNSFYD